MLALRPERSSEPILPRRARIAEGKYDHPGWNRYVRKLLPDSLGSLIDKMPAFKQGEALLVGESIALPSVVQIDVCITGPASTDIPYWALWKEQWKELAIDEIRDEWLRR